MIQRRSVVVRAACLVALLATTPGGAADRFFEGIDDLPLMPGLTEKAGERSTFDTAAGRIIARTAQGAVTPDAVLRFYGDTLPQLGWRLLASGIFTRGPEKLQIDFPARPAGVHTLDVRILITPS